jgi:hypothetical protein
MSLTYSEGSGIISAISSNQILDILGKVPDNTQKLINPRSIRDSILSVWENSVIRFTKNSSNIDYIGIARENVNSKIFLGKKKIGGGDVLSQSLLNSDNDFFFYNNKLDGNPNQNLKIKFLSGNNPNLFENSPYLEFIQVSGLTQSITTNLTHNQPFGGDFQFIAGNFGKIKLNSLNIPSIINSNSILSSPTFSNSGDIFLIRESGGDITFKKVKDNSISYIQWNGSDLIFTGSGDSFSGTISLTGISGSGSIDYISNVTFSNNKLIFTGTGSAFTGDVDINIPTYIDSYITSITLSGSNIVFTGTGSAPSGTLNLNLSGGSGLTGSGTMNTLTKWGVSNSLTGSSIWESNGRLGILSNDPKVSLEINPISNNPNVAPLTINNRSLNASRDIPTIGYNYYFDTVDLRYNINKISSYIEFGSNISTDSSFLFKTRKSGNDWLTPLELSSTGSFDYNILRKIGSGSNFIIGSTVITDGNSPFNNSDHTLLIDGDFRTSSRRFVSTTILRVRFNTTLEKAFTYNPTSPLSAPFINVGTGMTYNIDNKDENIFVYNTNSNINSGVEVVLPNLLNLTFKDMGRIISIHNSNDKNVIITCPSSIELYGESPGNFISQIILEKGDSVRLISIFGGINTNSVWKVVSINRVKKYKVCSFLLNQTGISNPVPTFLENELGLTSNDFTRTGIGQYEITKSGLFTNNKTALLVNNNQSDGITYLTNVSFERSGNNKLIINQRQYLSVLNPNTLSSPSLIDGISSNGYLFEIRIYN